MAQVVESCDEPNEPYHLCIACHRRLHARALRPVEWYNLVKRHGNLFLLHDDSYDEDGTACQPAEDVESPASFAAPSLATVAHDPRLLLDYSITRWRLRSQVAEAWAALPRADVLVALSERFASTSNAEIRSRVLEVCAAALDESGAELVRYAWGEHAATVTLASLAQASAACLPFREGFNRVTAALGALNGSRKRDSMYCLSYFHSAEALDWIEQNVFDPVTEAWGGLAAASELDWSRVENWLRFGRPLSLVAIDALAAISRPRNPLLRELCPQLHEPPTRYRFKQALLDYAERDSVPRVRQRTTWLIDHCDVLTHDT